MSWLAWLLGGIILGAISAYLGLVWYLTKPHR